MKSFDDVTCHIPYIFFIFAFFLIFCLTFFFASFRNDPTLPSHELLATHKELDAVLLQLEDELRRSNLGYLVAPVESPFHPPPSTNFSPTPDALDVKELRDRELLTKLPLRFVPQAFSSYLSTNVLEVPPIDSSADISQKTLQNLPETTQKAIASAENPTLFSLELPPPGYTMDSSAAFHASSKRFDPMYSFLFSMDQARTKALASGLDVKHTNGRAWMHTYAKQVVYGMEQNVKVDTKLAMEKASLSGAIKSKALTAEWTKYTK